MNVATRPCYRPSRAIHHSERTVLQVVGIPLLIACFVRLILRGSLREWLRWESLRSLFLDKTATLLHLPNHLIVMIFSRLALVSAAPRRRLRIFPTRSRTRRHCTEVRICNLLYMDCLLLLRVLVRIALTHPWQPTTICNRLVGLVDEGSCSCLLRCICSCSSLLGGFGQVARAT